MVAKTRGGDKPELPADRMLVVNSMPGLTPSERAVLIAIAYHDGPGDAWPSDARIVENTPLRFRGAIFEARMGLKKKGRLTWKNGKHRNVYAIAYGEPFEPEQTVREIPGQ